MYESSEPDSPSSLTWSTFWSGCGCGRDSVRADGYAAWDCSCSRLVEAIASVESGWLSSDALLAARSGWNGSGVARPNELNAGEQGGESMMERSMSVK